MDSFVTVLVICLISGLAFLLGSLLVVSRLPRTGDSGGSTAIEWNGIKVTTTSVFVALTIVSAALAVALPGFTLWLNAHIDDAPVILRATLPPARGASYNVVHSDDIANMSSSTLTLLMYKSRIPQVFSVSAAAIDPVNIEAHYTWMDKSIAVTLNNDKRTTRVLALSSGIADIGELSFNRAARPGVQTISKTPGPKPLLPAAASRVPDPMLPTVTP
ncbi:MAG: hypothetical protein QOJ39_1674 [Candidatus Eremiobacteraeota bacterium]|jgi:hypothetical protein|nr:hypothetical protein [Candidatus Eremiobacteraeota bacterium]MEA2719810.1 hypothetical protein [Candidatus Eremiobacteraeota bacterium]